MPGVKGAATPLIAALFATHCGMGVLAHAATPAAPAPAPQQDELLLPGAAVADDPELFQPLTPLAEFDIVTREPPADAAADPQPTEFGYSVNVTGLEGTTALDRFRALSALYDDARDTATLGQIQARAEADVALMQRLLHSEGYYDATVESTVDALLDQPGRAAVILAVTTGDRYRIGDIQIAGPPTQPPGLPRQALTLQTGDPLVAVAVEAAEANVRLQLPQRGYPFVEVGPRDVVLDDTDHTAAYTLPVEPGPLSSFGGVLLEGDPVFNADHVSVIARFDRGELYDERLVDDLRRALVATGLFSTVGVEPVRTGAPGPGGTEAVNLRVRSAAAPTRSLAAEAGYGTGEGLRLEGSWTHRNLFPPEGALTFRGVAGTKEQRIGAIFRRSNAGQRDRSLQLMAEGSRERREESYDATSLTLSGRLSRESTPIWRKRWTYSAGAELIASSETARQDLPARTFFIGALPLQLGYDRSDDLLDPTKGFRLLGRVSPEVSFRSGTAAYVRNILDASGYVPAGAVVLAGRARLGTIIGTARGNIAPSRRLYGGGGGSVRGFGFQELGPLNADGERIGGRSLVEFAVEARYRFGNFGVVPFFDVGQAYESVAPKFTNLRYGAGIGARYYTNFGPIRIDLARPLARRPGEPQVAVYISIGQAF